VLVSSSDKSQISLSFESVRVTCRLRGVWVWFTIEPYRGAVLDAEGERDPTPRRTSRYREPVQKRLARQGPGHPADTAA